jgi:hypothetical protein
MPMRQRPGSEAQSTSSPSRVTSRWTSKATVATPSASDSVWANRPRVQAAAPRAPWSRPASRAHMTTPTLTPGGNPVPVTVTVWPSTRPVLGSAFTGRPMDSVPSVGPPRAIGVGNEAGSGTSRASGVLVVVVSSTATSTSRSAGSTTRAASAASTDAATMTARRRRRGAGGSTGPRSSSTPSSPRAVMSPPRSPVTSRPHPA